MPELPEVETVVRGLQAGIPGRVISRIEVRDARAVLPLSPERFSEALTGATFRSVLRRGKFILFDFERVQMVTHLRMTGKFVLRGQQEAGCGPHIRLAFLLDDGTILLFQDIRRFGTNHIYPQGSIPEEINRLGPEPFAAELTPGYLLRVAARRHIPVKQLLLDQRVVAGLGNIYVCEILFGARVHPERKVTALSRAEWGRVIETMRTVLTRAIACNGTTISDFRAVDEKSGTFQEFLQVYGRAGAPCRRCGTAVEKCVQSGRGSWYCPSCQIR